MAKKGKGHSKKKRHYIGVPAQGVGISKERKIARKNRIKKQNFGECCGKPLNYVKVVRSTGQSVNTLFCLVCKRNAERQVA